MSGPGARNRIDWLGPTKKSLFTLYLCVCALHGHKREYRFFGERALDAKQSIQFLFILDWFVVSSYSIWCQVILCILQLRRRDAQPHKQILLAVHFRFGIYLNRQLLFMHAIVCLHAAQAAKSNQHSCSLHTGIIQAIMKWTKHERALGTSTGWWFVCGMRSKDRLNDKIDRNRLLRCEWPECVAGTR